MERIQKTSTEPWHCRFYACANPFNFTWINQEQWGNYANEANTYIIPVRHYTLESRIQNENSLQIIKNETVYNYKNETVYNYINISDYFL